MQKRKYKQYNRDNEVSEIHIPLSYNRNNKEEGGNIIVGCPKQTIHYDFLSKQIWNPHFFFYIFKIKIKKTTH